ncbi:DNRLRE domain-containing protein [Neobacillus mesonae]|uniref:DNRLRE domain-containing protein n=1 Tax=Neobacillus mesonae TaxID=1193713 RepID=UPI002E228850|nr:DNRLRE domain-containing protein [Neobacillus mesonae]
MFKKISVCFLIVLLLFTSLQPYNFINLLGQPPVEAAKEKAIPKTVQKVRELEEERELNSKTYVNSDGTYTKEIYLEDVHYKENGKLKTISNTPQVNKGKDKEEFKYTNKDNRFGVKFAKNSQKKNLYTMEFGNEKLNFQLLNAQITDAKSQNGSIFYEDILKNVDIKYSLAATGVKEDIFLNDRESEREFQFFINGSLEPRKEDRSINFYNKKNELVWTMSPPFMEDQNGKYSEEIVFDIEVYKNGYKLILKPDSKFLDEKDTKYPVRIDPSVNIGGSTSNTQDTYVMSKYSGYNYHTTPELRIGYTPSTGTTRSYLNFSQSLPNLTGKLLEKAELKLYKWNDIGTPISSNVYVNRITQSWNSQSVTYSTQPSFDTSKAYGSTSSTGSARWISMDVTSLVNGWMKGSFSNYGMVLRSTSEGSEGTYQKFNASESSSSKPYLAITYSDIPSAPTATPYSNQNGTGYVNLSWPKVNGATGYKVLIFNGRAYEEINVGNTTTWSTKGRKLWPTKAQIDNKQYGLRLSGDGMELPENPNYLYKMGGGNYTSSTNYWFRIKAYNSYSTTNQSNAATPTIPDKSKPTVPAGVQITNDRIDSFTVGWQASSDPNGFGVAKYKVYLGDQPGVWNILSGVETTALSYKYSGTLTPRKTYYARVQAVDKYSNISDLSSEVSKAARKEFDAQIENYYIPPTSDIDNPDGEQLWFDVRNNGTASWTNDLNISLSVTSTPPNSSTPTGFVGYLNTGEVIKPNQVKRFYVNWKPQKGVIGSYGLKAVVGKGTEPTYINPPENIIQKTIEVKDLKPPTGKLSINENNLYTTEQNVSLKVFDIFDNANGNKYVQFANGPENAVPENLTFSASKAVSQSSAVFNWALEDVEGNKYVYARFLDGSGNVSALTFDSIIYDRTLPKISITNLLDGDYISGMKNITGSITDKEISEYVIEYRNKSTNSSTWKLITKQSKSVTNSLLATWDTNSLTKGEYEVRFTATDAAGQSNMVSKFVWVDNLDKNWFGSEDYFPAYPVELLSGTGFVNLYNGSLNIADVDFSLKSRNLSLVLGRSYASNRSLQGMLGKGWQSNLEEHLDIQSSHIDYFDADGTIHKFTKSADGQYSRPAGSSYRLSVKDTKYELKKIDGSLLVKTFNQNGNLEQVTDHNGNVINFKYTDNVLTKVESLNKSITLAYNADSTLKEAVFSTGDKVSYEYMDGFLSDVKLYTKGGILSDKTHYDYQNGKMSAVIAENGLKVKFIFNGERLINTETMRSTKMIDETKNYPDKVYNSIISSFHFDLTTNKIHTSTNSINPDNTSKNLNNTEYELNSEGNLWKQRIIRTYLDNEDPELAKNDSGNMLIVTEYDQNLLKSVTDPEGNKTTYEYDAYGNVLKTILPPVTSNGVSSNYTLEYKYDGNGQLSHAYNTLRQVKEWKYDTKGNLSQVIDEEGNNQYFDYDAYGNLKNTRSDRGPLYGYIPDYSLEGDTLSDWQVEGTVTKVTTQSKSGKKSAELSPSSVLQTGKFKIKKGRLPVLAIVEGLAPIGSPKLELKLQYLKDDTVIKEIPKSYSLTNKWNKYRVSEAVPAEATHVRVVAVNKGTDKVYIDDLVLEESGVNTTYVYDSTGENVKEIIDPYGYKTTYTYNDYGQPLTETNALNQTQRVIYNEEQQVEKKEDQAGRITEYRYDAIGNVIKEINSLGQETNYFYNEWGQLVHTVLPKVKITSYKNETVDKVTEEQPKLYIQYDELGRKVKETDEKGLVHAEEFDGYGRTARIIDPMQNQKYFSYDKNGNILHTIDYAAKNSPDGTSKLLIAKGEMFATYDEWNRQLTETDNTGNRNVLTMINTYDSENRIIHTKDAEGTEFFYTFNALGENVYAKDNSKPIVETSTYYDGLGNSSITISGKTIEYSVTDANGNVVETIDHKGTKTVYEYNPAGDKVKQTNPDGSTVEWTYNKDGQTLTETQRVEDNSETTTYLVTHYDYNDAGEVKNQKLEAKLYIKSSGQTETQTLKETVLTYDELGRLVREYTKNFEKGTTATKNSDIRFLYDLNGNLIKKWIYDESSTTLVNGTTYPFVRSETIYKYDDNNRFTYEERVENGIVTRKEYKDDENAEVIQSALGITTVHFNENDLASKIITPNSQQYILTYTPSESLDMVKGPRLTVNMDYGTNEKMTLIETKKKDTTTVIYSESYTYSSEEQILSATNQWDGKKEYSYTPEGFLKTVKKGTETLTYSYDVNGNLLKAVNQSGKILVDNQYGQGNRITSSIQYDGAIQKYKKVNYTFKPDGSLQKEIVSIPVDTYEAAKTAAVEIEKVYEYASINMLLSITTKKGGTVKEKIEFTYDSEENRSTKKVTNADGERIEYYYYDGNGDLVSVSQKTGIDPIENLLNIYRDANGQLLSFEYKGQTFDYVYNQRGDIVAITDELQAVIAKYTYDEWGNLEKIDAPTPLGAEVANANPFRYVGKFGVQYDNDTKLYYMGWRDYDSKVGRFIVADEYEGEDSNPISFNRYLYAEADPVNNIDPDGYAPKWLKKVFKGVKKTAKAAYNFAIGDDIRTLTSKKTKWYQKAGAAFMIASNFIPGGGIIAKAAKAAIKGTSKAVKAVKVSRAVTKAAKVVRTTSKKVVAKVNKKPKTVPAKSFRSSPKTQSATATRTIKSAPKPKPKVTVAPKPARGSVTRVEKQAIKKPTEKPFKPLLKLDLQTFAAEGKGIDKTSYAREMGKLGESASGITKNTRRIESMTGKANYRIPDGLDEINQTLIEVKNVKRQGYTSQLKDFHLWSKENGYDFILMTRSDTKISRPLQQLIDSGDIIHKYIK